MDIMTKSLPRQNEEPGKLSEGLVLAWTYRREKLCRQERKLRRSGTVHLCATLYIAVLCALIGGQVVVGTFQRDALAGLSYSTGASQSGRLEATSITYDIAQQQGRYATGIPSSLFVPVQKFPSLSNWHKQALQDGSIGIIIEFQSESYRQLKLQQLSVLRQLENYSVQAVKRFIQIPYMAVHVDGAGLEALSQMVEVHGLFHDRLFASTLATSTHATSAQMNWSHGMTGRGQLVAILDTGIDATHPNLEGKIRVEACFSTTLENGQAKSLCPNGLLKQKGSGAARLASSHYVASAHGTHIADIAVGNGPTKGMAPDAGLMAIQVYSAIDDVEVCEGQAPCLRSFLSDQLRALEHVYVLREIHPVVAVNVSMGAGLFKSACDAEFPAIKSVVELLKRHGIATVAGAGNDGDPNAIAAPACVSNVISVGATTVTDQIADFSNGAQQVALFAPGEWITAAVPGNNTEQLSGTSMAAAHVTGAWALLKNRYPKHTVNQQLTWLQNNGARVSDSSTLRIDLVETQPTTATQSNSIVGASRITTPVMLPRHMSPKTVHPRSAALVDSITDFWAYEWGTLKKVDGQLSGSDEGNFLMILGEGHQIQGETLYEVKVIGDTELFGPRWRYLAIRDNLVLGSLDGEHVFTIFDGNVPRNTTIPGLGLFSDTTGYNLAVIPWDLDANPDGYEHVWITGQVIINQVLSNIEEEDCPFDHGLGERLCERDPVPTGFNEFEYYREGVGPLGYKQTAGVGGQTGSFYTESQVGLVFSSRWNQKILLVATEGQGTIFTSGEFGEVDCGDGCELIFDQNTSLTLTATGTEKTEFQEWIGCTSTSNNSCTVTMDRHHMVKARFQSLTVPSNECEITALPEFNDDGNYQMSWRCSALSNSKRQSRIEEDINTEFTNPTIWIENGTSGTINFTDKESGTYCYRVQFARDWSEPKCVTVKQKALLSVQVSEGGKVQGTGNIRGQQISCTTSVQYGAHLAWFGKRCQKEVTNGTAMTLKAEANPGWEFTRWVGCDSVNAHICNVTMTENRSVKVLFLRKLLGPFQPAPNLKGNQLHNSTPQAHRNWKPIYQFGR